MRRLAVPKPAAAQNDLLQLLVAVAVVAPKRVFEPTEVVVARGHAAAQAKQPVGALPAAVGEHKGDLHRRSALEIAERPAPCGGGPCRTGTHKDPCRVARSLPTDQEQRGFSSGVCGRYFTSPGRLPSA